jgi:deoxyribonuclease V
LPPNRVAIPRNPQEAIALQATLAPLISQQSNLPEQLTYVAGADVSYDNEKASGAAVLTAYDSLKQIETATVTAKVTFPYVPGLLSFREGPLDVQVLRRHRHRPEVCIVDGHGLAHPRRFGLACYVGLIMNTPTIGVAKSRLFGTETGESLLDFKGNVIATVLQHKRKSLYVSVGHKISLEDATRIVKRCISGRGLEPILLAHQEARKLRWSPKR